MDTERSWVRSSAVELKGYSRSIRLPALSIASAIFPSLLWNISRINSISTTAFMSKAASVPVAAGATGATAGGPFDGWL